VQAEAQGGAADATTALIPATEASNAPQCNHELETLPTHATERPQPQLTIAATDTLAQNQLVRADPAPNAVTGGLALVALPTLPTAEPKDTNAFDRLRTSAKGARPEATTPAYAKMDAVEFFKTLWEKFHGKLPAGLTKSEKCAITPCYEWMCHLLTPAEKVQLGTYRRQPAPGTDAPAANTTDAECERLISYMHRLLIARLKRIYEDQHQELPNNLQKSTYIISVGAVADRLMHAPASRNNGLGWNMQKILSECAKLQTFRSLYEETTKKETEKRKRAASEATGSTPTKRAAIEHPTVHQV